jgi:hypothetical protein
LAKANNIRKFPVGYPAAVLDRYAARPDNSSTATDAAERDFEERGEKSSGIDSLLHLLRLFQIGHLRPPVDVMTRARISLTVLVEQKVE